mgnify:CR=1 FL=1
MPETIRCTVEVQVVVRRVRNAGRVLHDDLILSRRTVLL